MRNQSRLNNKQLSTLAIIMVTLTLAGCNSNPSVPSSGSPSSIPPAGPPSSSPSSIPSGTPSSPSTSTSTIPSTQSGQSPGAPSSTQSGRSQSSGTENGADANASKQAGSGQQGDKTDDQILAEALEELGRRNQSSDQTGEGAQGESQRAGGSGSGEAEGAMTDAEKSAELDRQLGDKFAKFDSLILGEREGVQRDDNEQGGGRGTYGSGTGADDEGPLQTAMAEPPPSRANSGGSIGSTQPGDSVSEKAPDDVGNGQDDDIIARQLREAAMKERDPELRAKLWDEYRKYKKGS